MNRQRGFTLIELLVVIAIIALLMGILMPVLRKAREQGRDVVCRNNLRQIGFGANFYAEHYDSFIPRSAEWGGNIKPWFQLFMPFLAQKPIDDDYRNVEIFRCPSYPDKEQTVCYVVNGWGRENNNGWGMQRVATKLTTCDSPASTIYLADNEDGSWRTEAACRARGRASGGRRRIRSTCRPSTGAVGLQRIAPRPCRGT